jgi:hypothetical protein
MALSGSNDFGKDTYKRGAQKKASRADTEDTTPAHDIEEKKIATKPHRLRRTKRIVKK